MLGEKHAPAACRFAAGLQLLLRLVGTVALLQALVPLSDATSHCMSSALLIKGLGSKVTMKLHVLINGNGRAWCTATDEEQHYDERQMLACSRCFKYPRVSFIFVS